MFSDLSFSSLRTALLISVAAFGLSACATPQAGIYEPVITPVTAPSHTLRTLPPPRERISVAVYDFPDLTGQYKERDNVQSLSRAVTQGGAAMLIKALQDAGERRWFSVLDRARLDDILKERQIVTEMRRIYRDEQRVPASVLPPLRHAGVILQGGIVGYDTNTMTGGLGARYLGIGANATWQQDTVSVTLRAVATNTGEVLASVTIHKMIASHAIQGGAFRFVALDRILEAEAGVTQNEPRQIAVQQAIEKAVTSLIVEGADLGIWQFQDRERGAQIIAEYRQEKYGELLTAAAEVAPAPETPNPARVVETRPLPLTAGSTAAASAPAPTIRRIAPAPVAPAAPAPAPVPQLPPPAGEGEVLGSTPPAMNSTPASAGRTPSPAPAPVSAPVQEAAPAPIPPVEQQRLAAVAGPAETVKPAVTGGVPAQPPRAVAADNAVATEPVSTERTAQYAAADFAAAFSPTLSGWPYGGFR